MLGWFKKKFKKDSKDEKDEVLEVDESSDLSLDSEPVCAVSKVENLELSADKSQYQETTLKESVASEIEEPKKVEPQAVEVEDVEAEKEELQAIKVADTKQPSIEEENAPAPPEDNLEVESSVPQAEAKEKRGLLSRLKKRLVKTRESFVRRLDSVFLGKKVIDEELLEELEEVLITADLGVKTVQELLDVSRDAVKRDQLNDPQILYSVLKKKINQYLHDADKPAELVMPQDGPFVIMVLGVNGVGKTTTIGKLAHKFKQAGQKVLLVAADTFRAAAIDQLKLWAERVGVEISAQTQGADPSSVVYDAFDYGNNRDFDVIIVDTAGRIHTKVNLMEELKKIKRVMNKKMAGAPHEVMLVLDSTTGQNAVSQARQFNEAVDLTGLTLTKLDGTAKGGIVINISRELSIPIRFIGIGEQMEDLRDFHPDEFVEALFNK